MWSHMRFAMTQKPIGRLTYGRPAIPYERYMEEQEIPIHWGLIGVRDVRELALGSWKRMGGNGAFLPLEGTGNVSHVYVVEIPPRGTLNPEKHMYEEMFLVIEGRGSTEVWSDDSGKNQLSFEWQAGSVFSIPLNSWHRLVNGSSSPALILVAGNAPPIMYLLDNQEAIFNNASHFADRWAATDYSQKELETDPVNLRTVYTGAIVPDAVEAEAPYDGQRGVGHCKFAMRMCGNKFGASVAEYPSGCYSKCHAHEAGPLIACLTGKGYSITWPDSAGIRPWENGRGDEVKVQEYVPGGIVSAAPGGARWYHGHFGLAKDKFRVLQIGGGGAGPNGYPNRVFGKPGDEFKSMNLDLKEGGNTIEYCDEDPVIRQMFKEALEREGGAFSMPEELYTSSDQMSTGLYKE